VATATGKIARAAVVVGLFASLVLGGAFFLGGLFYGPGPKDRSEASAVEGLERLLDKGPEVRAAIAKSKDALSEEEKAKKAMEDAKANTKAAKQEIVRLVETLDVHEVLQALKALKVE